MKKSLVFMIAVFLVGALMISCNSEVAGNAAGDGKVVTVGVNLDNSSKALQTSVSNATDASGLYWFYTATKTDGSLFITGQTSNLTPVDANSTTAGYQAGLQGAVLGDFSTGGWTFSFYGYAAINGEAFGESSTPTGNPVYKCENLAVSITANTNLNVTIEAGEGMANAKLLFNNPTWTYSLAPEGTSLTLKVNDGTSQIATDTASTASNGTATFSQLPGNLTLSAGSHTLTFNVFYGSEQVGQATLSVVAKNGTTITVSGSIENLDSLYTVTVATVTNTVATAEITPNSTSKTVVTAAVTPASASAVTAQEATNTTVTFPSAVASTAYDEITGKTTEKSSVLTMDVRTLEDANRSFTVSNGSAVAAIDLSLTTTTTEKQGENILSTSESNVTGNFGGSGIVKVETYIAKNLTDISMKYGNETFTKVSSEDAVDANHKFFYVPGTGRLVFATDHFSEFYVTSTDEAYNATLGKAYATLASALTTDELADNHTVMLLKDVTTAAYINKSITLDGNGHSISGSGSTYKGTDGSGGYNNAAKYMLKVDAAVTVKNLGITSTGGARSIVVSSTCPSITLDNVNISSSGDYSNCVRFERVIHDSDPSSVRTTSCNVNISNCTFNCSSYALYMFGPVEGTITGTRFSCWNALYFKPGSTGSNLTISNSTIHEVSSSGSGGCGMSTPGGNGFGAVVYEESNISLAFDTCSFEMEVKGTAGQTLFMANDWNAINYNEHITINSGCTFTSIGKYEAFLVYSLTGGTTFDLKVDSSLESTLSDTVAAPETNEFDSIARVSTSNTIKLGFTGTGSTYGYGYSWQDSDTSGYKKLYMPEISTGYWMTGSLVNVGEYAVPITTDYISTALTKGTGVYTTVSGSPVTPTGKQWVSYSNATDDQKNGWYVNFATDGYYKLFTN